MARCPEVLSNVPTGTGPSKPSHSRLFRAFRLVESVRSTTLELNSDARALAHFMVLEGVWSSWPPVYGKLDRNLRNQPWRLHTEGHVIMSICLRFHSCLRRFMTISSHDLSLTRYPAARDVVLMVNNHTTHAQVSLIQESPLCDPTSCASIRASVALKKVPDLLLNLCNASFA
jgi:hypothetical protein